MEDGKGDIRVVHIGWCIPRVSLVLATLVVLGVEGTGKERQE